MSKDSKKQYRPINTRLEVDLADDLDKAVAVMKLGGVNKATGREWSREEYVRWLISKGVEELKKACGGTFPVIP